MESMVFTKFDPEWKALFYNPPIVTNLQEVEPAQPLTINDVRFTKMASPQTTSTDKICKAGLRTHLIFWFSEVLVCGTFANLERLLFIFKLYWVGDYHPFLF